MYTEGSTPRTGLGDRAVLESGPLKDPCDNCCFTFYYNMYVEDIGTLSVSLRSKGKDTAIWRLKGNQGKGWHLGRAPISNAPQNATVCYIW